MSIENLSPRDLVTIETTTGFRCEAEIVNVKRDRIQLVVKGPWASSRQFSDARQAIPLRDVVGIKRTGRAKL